MLNVVFASDNNYSSFLSIALISLLEKNSNEFNHINVYILDDGISEIHKNNLLKITKRYSCDIIFIKNDILDSLDLDLVPLENELAPKSLTTYLRLFIPTLLPKNIDKIIYLDCDALIVGSFKELWDMEINDYYCAGVIEGTVNDILKNEFWFFNVNEYINAGFLLINLKKWREDNVEAKFIKFLSKHQGKYFCGDQGVINIVFEDKIKIVEPKYNLLGLFQYQDYDIAKKFMGIEKDYYTKDIVDESMKNPVFVHFAGKGYDTPWENEHHRYSLDFKRYAKMVGFEDIINYKKAPTFFSNLLHNNYDNFIVKAILKSMPSKFIINRVNNNLLNLFRNEELKSK